MIEPESDVEIDLLGWAQTIQSARIQELARTRARREVANILHEYTGARVNEITSLLPLDIRQDEETGSRTPSTRFSNGVGRSAPGSADSVQVQT